jgi:hypothetical protein
VSPRTSVNDVEKIKFLMSEGSDGVPSSGSVKNFLFSTSSRPTLGSTQPPTQWVPGALSPEIKRQGREAEYSPSTSVKVKKMWIYRYEYITPYAFMAYCLIS